MKDSLAVIAPSELGRFRTAVASAGRAGPVTGHAGNTALSARATVGDRGGAPLCATARTLCSVRWRPCRIAAVGQRQTADDPRAHGGARDVGPDPALAVGRAAVSVLVGHRGDGGGGVRLPCLCASRARGTRRHTTPTLDRVVTRLESESYQSTRRAPATWPQSDPAVTSHYRVTLPQGDRSGWGSS